VGEKIYTIVAKIEHKLRGLEAELGIIIGDVHPILSGANSFSILRHKFQSRLIKHGQIMKVSQY
jgi:hypothetical protein